MAESKISPPIERDQSTYQVADEDFREYEGVRKQDQLTGTEENMQFKQELDGDFFPTDVEVKLEEGVDDESMRMKYEVKVEPTGSEEIDEQVEDDSTGAGSPETVRKRHLTGTEKKSCECKSCGKTLSCIGSLKRHMLTHSGEKSHKCGECDRAFALLSTLKNHQLSHTGVKEHQCAACGKYFARLSYLKEHKLYHTGETPHKCKDCDKSFASLSTLIHHKVTHTGEKRYGCEYCDKRYAEASSLRRHRSIHTGVKLP